MTFAARATAGVLITALAGCYQSPGNDCVIPCGTQDRCPSAFSCSNGYCTRGPTCAGDAGTDSDRSPANDAGGAGADGSSADGSSADGSDGAVVMTGIAPTVAGQVLISEIQYDPATLGDDFGEWFEVYNPSADVTYNLLGCSLNDMNNSAVITTSVVVPPGSYHTFALSAMSFAPDFVYSGVKFDNQSPDSVSIMCGGIMIDRFGYDPGDGMVGHTFSVDPSHLKSGENSVVGNYCLSNVSYLANGAEVDYGTPNAVNPPCPAGQFPW